ncbi:hypothetical protein FKR81_15095 [Lentzea tibetensis]|uniref:Uncharacterized protein n=1 Tax=Lentzea tibetensis TaxID=2591470 RepID=A0A563EWL7_9PSEU|nr:hypothetical protein [Lentzea tibetensis]TWP51524.1 hypothetical protein FKR81_15095 [Lentzea tibetensis]
MNTQRRLIAPNRRTPAKKSTPVRVSNTHQMSQEITSMSDRTAQDQTAPRHNTRIAVAVLSLVVLVAGCGPATGPGIAPQETTAIPPRTVDEVWGENVTVDGHNVPYFSAKCDANNEPYDVKPPYDLTAKAAARRVCKDGEAEAGR